MSDQTALSELDLADTPILAAVLRDLTAGDRGEGADGEGEAR